MKGFSKQKITPFLWFNDNAEAAANFYVSVFKNSKILDVSRYPEGAPAPAGSVMTVTFRLAGQDFIALNGGPGFKFTEAVSLFVNCDTQAEIDLLWRKLGAGGQVQQCGWLKDKFGFSWQIAPGILHDLLQDKDRDKASRVMDAMMKMRKIDIAKLKTASADRRLEDVLARSQVPRSGRLPDLLEWKPGRQAGVTQAEVTAGRG